MSLLDDDYNPLPETDSSIDASLIDRCYALARSLDLSVARELLDDVRGMLAEGAVAMEAGAVEHLSTPCAQVLLATGRAADAAGASFRIHGASQAFRRSVADLGLQSEFSNWMS